jgi:hypothetical protein
VVRACVTRVTQMALVLMLAMVALNPLLLALAPQYTSFGAQEYQLGNVSFGARTGVAY